MAGFSPICESCLFSRPSKWRELRLAPPRYDAGLRATLKIDCAKRIGLMEIVFRRLTADDGFVLDSVAEDVFDEPIDARRLADYLAERSHIMMVAIAGQLVVGQCAAVVHRHPDKATELYIDEIGVAPEFKRRGIARRLLEDMLALGKALGCEEAWVGTESDNQPARGLYETQGATAEAFAMYVIKL